jgi:hypothetical protein
MGLRADRMLARKQIERNIARHGFHQYVVAQRVVPRFSYSIGLRDKIGADLVLAGGIQYMADDVGKVFQTIHARLMRRRAFDAAYIVPDLGRFTLREVHPSWADLMLLGAYDYYNVDTVVAYQLVPDQAHWTLDVPDMAVTWNSRREPAWQWLRAPWQYSAPPESETTTNLDALRGKRITEVTRWDDGWEMFAGAGPSVGDADIRVVPLGCLLATDPSLERALALSVGEGIWRDSVRGDWNPWRKSQ